MQSHPSWAQGLQVASTSMSATGFAAAPAAAFETAFQRTFATVFGIASAI